MLRMRPFIERFLNCFAHRVGYQVMRIKPQLDGVEFPPDFEESEIEDYVAVRPFTLTSRERIVSLSRAVRYVVENGIPGDIVECGVWRGGSVMAILKMLLRLGEITRDVYLFDTFAGMASPTREDVSFYGEIASRTYRRLNRKLIAVSLDEVKKNVLGVGYDPRRIHFIKGKVEDTLPSAALEKISLLRLDTDWYESTLQEMEHLYPRLSPRGVLIIEDYGCWKGSRKAIDEYVSRNKVPLLLNRIDYTCRMAVKA